MDIRCTFLERIEALILVASFYFFLDPEFRFLDIRFLKSFAAFLQGIFVDISSFFRALVS